ncbi:RecF/RecN/SMC N-terminal domain-containing protein [Entamoeba marina]
MDAIYETLESQAKKATVEIELIHKNGTEKKFSRSVIGSGSEYRINDKVTSEKEYQKELKDLNIDVKARNFLEFQGDVVEVASKTGKELTKLIESISGSEELGVQYEELKKRKSRRTYDDIQYKAMKEEAEECEKLEEELNDKKKELMLVDIRHFEKGMNKYINEEKEKKKKVEELLQDKIEKEGKFDEITQNLRKLENNEKHFRKLKPLEGRVFAKKKIATENVWKKERELTLYNQKSIDEENRLKELNTECRIDNVYIACSDSSRRARETEEFELSKDIELLKEKIQLEENKNSSTLKMELEQELASNQNILNNEIKQQEIEIENQLVTANENIEKQIEKVKISQTDAKKDFVDVDTLIKSTQKDQSHLQSLYGKLKAGLDEIIRKSRLEQIDLPILNETQTQASKVTMDLLTQSTAITIPQYDYSIIDKLKVRNLEEYNKIL